MNRRLKWLLPPVAALLSSCAIYAPKERTELNSTVPGQFSLYSAAAPDSVNRWWESFQSQELDSLVDEALTNSPTLQQAWARLAQAEAIAAKAGAARSPTLDYSGKASSSRQKTTIGQNPGTDSYNSFSLGLGAAYEADLWGRIKSQTEAAALDRDASREQLNTSAITLAAQTALGWTGIVAQRLQTELIRRQLESNKTSLELIELRFRKSLATALDVYQQRQVVAGTESRIPLAELREELLRNGLAALLGRTDFRTLEIADTNLPRIGNLPAIGIPADVLANRPDVRRAGLLLQSADWAVSAARADRLPAIRLTAEANYGGTRVEMADVFDNWFANLAGSVTGPIFDGGRRKAEVERTRAVVDERLAAYRETVINAIKEVEDALVSEQKQHDYVEALDRNIELSRSSYNEAVNRYRNGLIEYLPVLVDLVSLQNLERDRVEAQYNLLQYRINLYRALGGSWPQEFARN
ncbi:MAG: efflux transporter outer membrane subunit [Kiritimatiellales bacterium]|nr:efflux transporter outer membrane subunit [Kiritimatiellales bacterium]MCF7863958.1 efflux transporter outer membrane subunit [Kiritimatiellales bacterium]